MRHLSSLLGRNFACKHARNYRHPTPASNNHWHLAGTDSSHPSTFWFDLLIFWQLYFQACKFSGKARWWATGWGLGLPINAVFMILLHLCPESPRYLFLEKKDVTGAREGEMYKMNSILNDDISALCKIRGTSVGVEEELEEMEQERKRESGEAKEDSLSIKQLVMTSSLRLPLLIAVVLQVLQQLSGINAVRSFSSCLIPDCLITLDYQLCTESFRQSRHPGILHTICRRSGWNCKCDCHHCRGTQTLSSYIGMYICMRIHRLHSLSVSGDADCCCFQHLRS